MSYVVAAYVITGGSLILYAAALYRERAGLLRDRGRRSNVE